MFLNTIDKKPIIRDGKNQYIKDLTKSIFDFDIGTYINTSVYRVPKGFEMRPDLISYSVYNNTLYAEFILKYNGISNPFTIAPNDIILIPVLDEMKDHIKVTDKNNNSVEENRIRNTYKYIDPTKIPQKDKTSNTFNNRNLDNNQTDNKISIKEGSLPPNLTKESDNGITYRNGRVYFGENIGQSACLKNGMSSSEFLTKVIKRK